MQRSTALDARRALLGLILGAAVACQLVTGLERPEPTSLDAGSPSSNEGGTGVPVNDPCVHAAPPGPPDVKTPAAAVTPQWLLMTAIDVSTAPNLGFDLDKSCTCHPDHRDGATSCASSSPAVCDDPSGVDNAFAGPFAAFVNDLRTMESARTETDLGKPNTLIFLGNYNGELDDEDVRVTIIPSAGLRSNEGCPEASIPRDPTPNPTFFKPRHDGCDQWRPGAGQTFEHDGGLLGFARPGYVTKGRLVVTQVGDRTFPKELALLGRFVNVNDMTLTATLVRESGRFKLVDGVATARVDIPTLVSAIGESRSPSGELRCVSSQWSLLKQALCTSLDIRTEPVDDQLAPPERCDGFALTWRFEAEPVLVESQTHIEASGIDSACPREVCPEPFCLTKITTVDQLCDGR